MCFLAGNSSILARDIRVYMSEVGSSSVNSRKKGFCKSWVWYLDLLDRFRER